MKTLFSLLTIISPYWLFAQEISLPIKDGKVVYENVITATGLQKSVLESRVKKWLPTYSNNSNTYVILLSLSNPDLKVKGQFDITGLRISKNIFFDYTIEIVCKDEKFRIRIYDIKYKTLNRDNYAMDIEFLNDSRVKNGNAQAKEQISAMDEKFKKIITELANKIKTNDDF